MSNSLDSDQDRHFVGPDLSPNCLQRLLAEDICCSQQVNSYSNFLSYDVASGSEITQCNKIDKPLVVYRIRGNVMTSIATLRT